MTERQNAADNLDQVFSGSPRTGFFDHHCRPALLADAGRYGGRGHQDRDIGRRDDADPPAGAQFLQHRLWPAQYRQEESRARSEIARRRRGHSPAGCERGRVGRKFPPGRDAAAEAGLRAAERAQSETDLLFDLRLRPDRAIGGTAGLCACDPCRLRLRDGASRLSARPKPAGLLRDLSRRRADRGLRLRRHFGGAVSAPRHRTWPAHRRLDAGIDAQPDAQRVAVVAIRGEAEPASDVRADRNRRWLCDGRDRQRKDLPEPDEGDRPSGVGDRPAFCGLFRSSRQLGQPDGGRRGVVAQC